MDTLGSIIEVIRDYLNRCVKCSKCRQGTCPWICNFLTPEASAITENADQKTTHEARAMALYEMAGCPCEQQLTFDDFIDRIDSFATKAKMPENGAELFATLRTLEEFPSRLGRMTKGARLAFADAIYSAIEHTLAALDYYYLRHGHCIKELLQQVHPSYNREEMFKLTGKIKSFTDKLIKKAKPLKWDEEAIDDQPATDPVKTATADIPTELSSPEAMRYWHRAQDAQLLDNHFHFIGTKTELKFFVTAIGCGIAGYQPEEIAPMFLDAAYLPNVYLPLSFWKVLMKIPRAKESVRAFAQSVLDVCRYAHRNNPPTWTTATDEALFSGLERDQQWQLGILMGIISPADEEPQTKGLPDELERKILDALKKV